MLTRHILALTALLAAQPRRLLAGLLAAALIVSGTVTAAMAVEHAIGAGHKNHPHAVAGYAAETPTQHDGCTPGEAQGDGGCCGHVACIAGWSLSALPATPAAQPRARVVNASAPSGPAASLHFPTLEPPKV